MYISCVPHHQLQPTYSLTFITKIVELSLLIKEWYRKLNELKWMWFPDLELTDVRPAGELSWRSLEECNSQIYSGHRSSNRHNLIHPDIFCRIKTVKNPRSIFDTNYRLIRQSCLFICYFISRIIPDILGKWRHTSGEFPKLATLSSSAMAAGVLGLSETGISIERRVAGRAALLGQ